MLDFISPEGAINRTTCPHGFVVAVWCSSLLYHRKKIDRQNRKGLFATPGSASHAPRPTTVSEPTMCTFSRPGARLTRTYNRYLMYYRTIPSPGVWRLRSSSNCNNGVQPTPAWSNEQMSSILPYHMYELHYIGEERLRRFRRYTVAVLIVYSVIIETGKVLR